MRKEDGALRILPWYPLHAKPTSRPGHKLTGGEVKCISTTINTETINRIHRRPMGGELPTCLRAMGISDKESLIPAPL